MKATVEQVLLEETVRRLVTSIDRPARGEWRTRDRRIWPELVGMGLPGMCIPDEFGGSGGSIREATRVMMGWGAAQQRAPLVPTAVVCARVVELAGSSDQKRLWLAAIAEGRMKVAVAELDAPAGSGQDCKGCIVRTDGDGLLLDGCKIHVIDGDAATHFLVTVRRDTMDGAAGEPALLLVDARAQGVGLVARPTLDGGGVADVSFRRVRLVPGAMLEATGQAAALAFEIAMDRGRVALCSEAVGNMVALLEQCVSYLNQRVQFGQKLAQFQVLRHHVSDIALEIGSARAAVELAVSEMAEAEEAIASRRAVAAAKYRVGEAGRRVGEIALQLHGGMGMTDELPIGHFFKRLHVIELTWGDAMHHLRSYQRLAEQA